MIRVYETESMYLEVVCNHPDDSSRSYVFGVENNDEYNIWDADEQEQYWSEICSQICEKVNRYHYWHEVVISGVWVIGDEMYRKEIGTFDSYGDRI